VGGSQRSVLVCFFQETLLLEVIEELILEMF